MCNFFNITSLFDLTMLVLFLLSKSSYRQVESSASNTEVAHSLIRHCSDR